ncbi:MAG TPA: hypothetical protein VN783_06655 [Thermoanaerobaculia bacterium]|nr:hypothetical protein [Thermoanaerobaculia bacterium]
MTDRRFPARRALLALALAASCTTAARAQASPRLTATVAAGRPLTVGDRAVVTIELAVAAADLAGAPRFPAWGKTWGDAEVAAVGPVERQDSGGLANFRQRVTVAAFRTGPVPLPPLAITVPLRAGAPTLATPAGLSLTVASVLPADPKQARPKPPAGLRRLPWGSRFWWTLAAFALLALATGWLALHRRLAAGAEAPAPEIAPRDELERALERIAREIAAGEPPEPCVAALSAALRRFLGRELDFHGLESTTTEVQRLLRSRRIPDATARQATDLLRRLDLIKFARRASEPREVGSGIATARALAGELEDHLRPAAVPPGGAALEAAR